MNFSPGRIAARGLFSLLFAAVAFGSLAIESHAEQSAESEQIRQLLNAESCVAANERADRWVSEMQARFGDRAAETWDARLLQTEVRIRCRTDSDAGSSPIDSLEKQLPAAASTPVRRAVLERLRGQELLGDNRFERSVTHLDRCMELLRQAGAEVSSEFARAEFLKARCVRMRGRSGEALRSFERACETFERVGGPNDVELLHALEYLALSDKYAQDPAGALSLFDRIVPELERQLGENAPHMIGTHYRHAIAYAQLGRYDSAKRACQRGIEIAAKDPQVAGRASLGPLYWLAQVALEEHQPELADSLATAALRAASQDPARTDLGAAGVSLRGIRMTARYQLGRIDEAEFELDRLGGLLTSKEQWSTSDSSSSVKWRGRFALARGECERATELLELGSAIDRRERSRELGPNASRTGGVDPKLALCHWLCGRVRDAFDLALDVEEDNRKELRINARTLSDEDALRLEARRVGGLGVALTALTHTSLGRAEIDRAYDAVIRSRAVVLDAVTRRHVGVRSSKDPAVVALAESLEVLERRATALAMRPEGTTGSEREAIASQRRTWTARLAALESSRARLYDGVDVGESGVRGALPGHARLVSYVRFEGHAEPAGSRIDDLSSAAHYAAFVVDSDSRRTSYFDLGSAAELDPLIERWRARVVAGDTGPELTSVGDSLRRYVWDPVSGGMDARTVVYVVPDGSIALVPLQALPAPGGRFVLEQTSPFTYLSAERDLASPSSTSRPGDGALVIGDPDFSSASSQRPPWDAFQGAGAATFAVSEAKDEQPTFRGLTSDCDEFRDLRFTRIAQSGAEAREVAALVQNRGITCALLERDRASEDAFKRLAPGRRYVHVASHGFALSVHCQTQRGAWENQFIRSGIALAGANARADLAIGSDREDGILTSEEVAVLDLTKAECVVLSACESGVGEVVTGEGVMGMRRAFHQAGAATLVSSLWKVDDSSTRAWMREFYRGLFGTHVEAAKAAHEASLALVRRLRKAGQDPSPTLWGAFVVCGVARDYE